MAATQHQDTFPVTVCVQISTAGMPGSVRKKRGQAPGISHTSAPTIAHTVQDCCKKLCSGEKIAWEVASQGLASASTLSRCRCFCCGAGSERPETAQRVNDVVPQSGATARTRAAWDPVVTSRLATFLRPDGDSSKTLGIWASEALKPAFIRRTKGD